MPPLKSLVGQRFGRLFVMMRAEYAWSKPPRGKHIYWTCLCDCGVVKNVQGDNLKSGDIRSCGCLLRELELSGGGSRTHGATRHKHQTAEYRIWAAMIQRCTNPNNKEFHRYGGRGIRVCKRWRSFENFIADMGEKPDKFMIERKNNDGNYSPDNCKWATAIEQANNRRKRSCYRLSN